MFDVFKPFLTHQVSSSTYYSLVFTMGSWKKLESEAYKSRIITILLALILTDSFLN